MRIFYKKNSGLKDISKQLANYIGESVLFDYKLNDYLYIASDIPFTGFFFDLSEFNDVTANTIIEIYNGDEWVSAVDIQDETNGLKNNGYLRFSPDIDDDWGMVKSSKEIIELNTLNIYYKYWARISFDAELLATTELKYIGHMFCNDGELALEYPDLMLTSTLNNFENGKTTWQPQAIRATDIVIRDIVNIGVIESGSQIFDYRDYSDATIHKLAEIIFNSFGDAYRDQSQAARQEYQARLNRRLHKVDRNKNAIKEPFENNTDTGFMKR
jgi:hypothetical protein